MLERHPTSLLGPPSTRVRFHPTPRACSSLFPPSYHLSFLRNAPSCPSHASSTCFVLLAVAMPPRVSWPYPFRTFTTTCRPLPRDGSGFESLSNPNESREHVQSKPNEKERPTDEPDQRPRGWNHRKRRGRNRRRYPRIPRRGMAAKVTRRPILPFHLGCETEIGWDRNRTDVGSSRSNRGLPRCHQTSSAIVFDRCALVLHTSKSHRSTCMRLQAWFSRVECTWEGKEDPPDASVAARGRTWRRKGGGDEAMRKLDGS